jgi:hypothetical protein
LIEIRDAFDIGAVKAANGRATTEDEGLFIGNAARYAF